MIVALNPLDPTSLLSAFGMLGVFAVLFTAWLLCATGPHRRLGALFAVAR